MHFRSITLLTAAVAVTALAGCGSSPEAPKKAAAPAAPAASPAPSGSIDAGRFDAASAYLTALRQVDGALVTDAQQALDRGMATCVDIEERRPAPQQEQNVATRFAVTPAEARKILVVTRDNLCLQ